jgi:hypothetical protein
VGHEGEQPPPPGAIAAEEVIHHVGQIVKRKLFSRYEVCLISFTRAAPSRYKLGLLHLNDLGPRVYCDKDRDIQHQQALRASRHMAQKCMARRGVSAELKCESSAFPAVSGTDARALASERAAI